MNLAISAIRAELNAPPAIARILWTLYQENRDLRRDEIADLTGLKQTCIKVYLCNLRASFYGHWIVLVAPGLVGLTKQGREGVKAILKRMLQEARDGLRQAA